MHDLWLASMSKGPFLFPLPSAITDVVVVASGATRCRHYAVQSCRGHHMGCHVERESEGKREREGSREGERERERGKVCGREELAKFFVKRWRKQGGSRERVSSLGKVRGKHSDFSHSKRSLQRSLCTPTSTLFPSSFTPPPPPGEGCWILTDLVK